MSHNAKNPCSGVDSTPSYRILIVDDNEQIQADFRRALAAEASEEASELADIEQSLFGNASPSGGRHVWAEYRIESALQGEEGCQSVRAAVAAGDPFQLAFVDMRMPPGWDGLKTIEACWGVDRNLHIVICTAYSDYSWDEIQARLGRSDRLLILRKPFDPVEVSQIAAAMTEKWRLAQQAMRQTAELEERVRQRTDQLEQALKADRLRLDLLEAVVEQRTSDIRHAAMHDALTGLPNRSMLSDRLSRALARYREDPCARFAVLFLDLDDFKLVNDTLGHNAGDALLREVANRISQSIRTSDRDDDANFPTIAARLGGDEFVVLLQGLRKFADAEVVAQRLLSVLRQPYHVEGRQVRCGVSIGVTTCAGGYADVEQILRDADIAMYKAKSTNKNRYVVFAPRMHRDVVERVSLEADIRKGLEAQQFVLHYQPIVSLVTGALAGFESLVRWNHPTRGMISPDSFIPLAEATGLIRPLGLWAIEHASRQVVKWTRQYPDLRIPVSVNLSTRQLDDEALVPEIDRRLKSTGVDPSRLVLEITEGSLEHGKRGGDRLLTSLRALQIQVYIDDFGMGYSSLGRLPQLPIDGLKIDRVFISEAGGMRKYAAILNAIVNLARHMDASIVAEGVESIEHVALLQALDCEKAQGFYFSPAVPAEQTERFFRENWQIACTMPEAA
jgi:diguanylate cyclase (GGDEF)-like protein